MRRFLVPSAIAGGVIAASIAFAGPALAAPTVTVSPSSGLANGASVNVTFSGFPANASLFILECNATAATSPGATHCDLGTAKPVTANASGAGSGTFTVKTGTVGDGTCPPASGDCLVAVSDATGANAGGAPIKFASSGSTSGSTGGSTSGSTGGSTGAVSGGTTTSTGKPFTLELGLGALLLAAGLAFGVRSLRRGHAGA